MRLLEALTMSFPQRRHRRHSTKLGSEKGSALLQNIPKGMTMPRKPRGLAQCSSGSDRLLRDQDCCLAGREGRTRPHLFSWQLCPEKGQLAEATQVAIPGEMPHPPL